MTLEDMLIEGRKQVAGRRETEVRVKDAADQRNRQLQDRRFEPLQRAIKKQLPAAWQPFVDLGRGEFDGSYGDNSPTGHWVLVNLPGCAPIQACFSVQDWSDKDAKLGIWHLSEKRTFCVARFTRERGSDGPFVMRARQNDWLEADTDVEAMALAEEEEQKRLKLQAEVDEERKLDGQRQLQRLKEKQEQPSRTDVLIAALKDFIAYEA